MAPRCSTTVLSVYICSVTNKAQFAILKPLYFLYLDMDLFKIDHEIVLIDSRPMIQIKFIANNGQEKTILFSYAELKYFILNLETAKSEMNSKIALQMNRYIH